MVTMPATLEKTGSQAKLPPNEQLMVDELNMIDAAVDWLDERKAALV